MGGAITPGGERVAGVTTWPDLRLERDRCVAAGTVRPVLLPLPPRRPPQPGGISCPSCREQFKEPASSPGLEGETLPGALRGSIARMHGDRAWPVDGNGEIFGGVRGHDESVSHRPREEMLGGELENCVGPAKCAFLGCGRG